MAPAIFSDVTPPRNPAEALGALAPGSEGGPTVTVGDVAPKLAA